MALGRNFIREKHRLKYFLGKEDSVFLLQNIGSVSLKRIDVRGICVEFNLLIRVSAFYRKKALQISQTALIPFPLSTAGIWALCCAPMS